MRGKPLSPTFMVNYLICVRSWVLFLKRNEPIYVYRWAALILIVWFFPTGLVDEQQKVRTITALALAALAEAATPYGIESFDSVLKPLWKGIRQHRGKVSLVQVKSQYLRSYYRISNLIILNLVICLCYVWESDYLADIKVSLVAFCKFSSSRNYLVLTFIWYWIWYFQSVSLGLKEV